MKNQFSADYASYEIFEPNRKRFWYNQLFNAEGYTASVTNVGHGTSRYIDQTATHAVLNEREERFLYLRDEESKACWSVGKFPLMEPVDRLFCEHSMGFSRIETDNLGIEAAWTLFVPVHGYHEVWLLRLRNTTDRPRTISAFPLVSFDLGGFQQPAYYVPFNCTETIFDGQLQGIFAWNKNPHNPHPRYSGFLASSLPPAAYDGCLERFLGIMGSTARPERLLAGEACTNSLTTVLGLGAVLQNTVTLLPGQKQTICYRRGLLSRWRTRVRRRRRAFAIRSHSWKRRSAQCGRNMTRCTRRRQMCASIPSSITGRRSRLISVRSEKRPCAIMRRSQWRS